MNPGLIVIGMLMAVFALAFLPTGVVVTMLFADNPFLIALLAPVLGTIIGYGFPVVEAVVLPHALSVFPMKHRKISELGLRNAARVRVWIVGIASLAMLLIALFRMETGWKGLFVILGTGEVVLVLSTLFVVAVAPRTKMFD